MSLSASGLSTDAVNEIRDSILSDSTSFAGANVDAAISSRAQPGDAMTLTAATTASISDQVWEEILADHQAVGTTGRALSDASGSVVDNAAIADAVWDEARNDHVSAGTFGQSVSLSASGLSTDAVNEIRDSILSDSTSFAGANVDAAISSRAQPGDLMSLSASGLSTDAVNEISASILADSTPISGALIDVAISTVSGAINGLNNLSIADVQTALTNQGYTTGRAVLLDNLTNLDVAISDISSSILALNDLSQTDVQAAMTSQGYTTARAALLDNLDAAVTSVSASVDNLLTLQHGSGSWQTGTSAVLYESEPSLRDGE
jgi:hypothetical protein